MKGLYSRYLWFLDDFFLPNSGFTWSSDTSEVEDSWRSLQKCLIWCFYFFPHKMVKFVRDCVQRTSNDTRRGEVFLRWWMKMVMRGGGGSRRMDVHFLNLPNYNCDQNHIWNQSGAVTIYGPTEQCKWQNNWCLQIFKLN